MKKKDLVKHINEVYEQLGRAPKELRLRGRSKTELKDILEKLKAIKYSFDLIFSSQQGIELAREVLISVFKEDDGR